MVGVKKGKPMASVNKVIIVGNLGQKPELRTTPGGQAVANFSVATNEKWQDKAGATQEKTEWHKIVVWGKTAENCAQYLDKGRPVYIEGKLQTRQWEDKDKVVRYSTEIQAQTVQFLGGNPGAGAGRPAAAGTIPAPSAGAPASFSQDDIPF